MRSSRQGLVAPGEGKNLFSREKRDTGADLQPPSPKTNPFQEKRQTFYIRDQSLISRTQKKAEYAVFDIFRLMISGWQIILRRTARNKR